MEERRRATDGFENRLIALERNVSQLRVDMEHHNKLGAELQVKLDQISSDTVVIRDIMQESRAAFRFAARIGSMIRWAVKYLIVPFALAVGAVYIIKGGTPPSWVKEWVHLFTE